MVVEQETPNELGDHISPLLFGKFCWTCNEKAPRILREAFPSSRLLAIF